jgi:methyl-accepting chemotaxis protein
MMMLLSYFKKTPEIRQEENARAIQASLTGRWDLDKKFSLPGEGPAIFLTEALNLVFSRLVTFLSDLTKKSVDMATIAPLTNTISQKVLFSAESLSKGAEQIEGACRNLVEGIGKSSESANQALDQSADIIQEIDQARTLTDQALERMQSISDDVGQLSSSINALDQRSRSIGSIIESISEIADNTGLLSLNAFIEAARAGEHGAGFSVISREIRQLSQETANAAREVKESLLAISELIKQTVTAVSHVQECVGTGLQVNKDASMALKKVGNDHHQFHSHLGSVISVVKDQKKSVDIVSNDISNITNIGKDGITNSKKLAELANKINSLTEDQLLATGIFILPQYRKAEMDVVSMAKDPVLCALGGGMDEALKSKMMPFSYLELVYVTDKNGRQVSSNVFRKDGALVFDTATRGKDWGQKAWFRKVIETENPFISEIYRSEATNTFCLTISVPIWKETALVGVLGADINFEDLLNI